MVAFLKLNGRDDVYQIPGFNIHRGMLIQKTDKLHLVFIG